MIKVLINQEGKNFKSLEVKGHANSAPHGEDLICAAVSSIITGGLNNLNNPKGFNLKLEEGYAYIEAKDSISSHDEVSKDYRRKLWQIHPNQKSLERC